jgi:hypothetical protein
MFIHIQLDNGDREIKIIKCVVIEGDTSIIFQISNSDCEVRVATLFHRN